ncbi:hypothetical protein C2E23DRAFT_880830 [Lenzites betulinus]|nr:hypothetical protein C2E23DRAFT_880830 [Lenzites betulinus]
MDAGDTAPASFDVVAPAIDVLSSVDVPGISPVASGPGTQPALENSVPQPLHDASVPEAVASLDAGAEIIAAQILTSQAPELSTTTVPLDDYSDLSDDEGGTEDPFIERGPTSHNGEGPKKPHTPTKVPAPSRQCTAATSSQTQPSAQSPKQADANKTKSTTGAKKK